MKRTRLARHAPLLRTAELKSRSRPKPWKRAPDDKVSPDMAAYIAARDRRCVLSIVEYAHICRNRYGEEISPAGEYEIDHVDNGGTGNRGASVKTNLVRSCPFGHRAKTDNARYWRPLLREYLRTVEGSCWRDAA